MCIRDSHYVVLENGVIQLGRSIEKNPASATGHNQGAIAVVATGNFSERPMPHRLDPQARAVGLLVAFLVISHDVPLYFHRDLANMPIPSARETTLIRACSSSTSNTS